jgi:preprotein translocase subunit SecD
MRGGLQRFGAWLVAATGIIGCACLARAADRLHLAVAAADSFYNPAMPADRGLTIKLMDASAADFARWTARYVGRRIAVRMGDRVVSSPRLMTPIESGVLQISNMNDRNLQALADKLVRGGLPLSVEAID